MQELPDQEVGPLGARVDGRDHGHRLTGGEKICSPTEDRPLVVHHLEGLLRGEDRDHHKARDLVLRPTPKDIEISAMSHPDDHRNENEESPRSETDSIARGPRQGVASPQDEILEEAAKVTDQGQGRLHGADLRRIVGEDDRLRRGRLDLRRMTHLEDHLRQFTRTGRVSRAQFPGHPQIRLVAIMIKETAQATETDLCPVPTARISDPGI